MQKRKSYFYAIFEIIFFTKNSNFAIASELSDPSLDSVIEKVTHSGVSLVNHATNDFQNVNDKSQLCKKM